MIAWDPWSTCKERMNLMQLWRELNTFPFFILRVSLFLALLAFADLPSSMLFYSPPRPVPLRASICKPPRTWTCVKSNPIHSPKAWWSRKEEVWTEKCEHACRGGKRARRKAQWICRMDQILWQCQAHEIWSGVLGFHTYFSGFHSQARSEEINLLSKLHSHKSLESESEAVTLECQARRTFNLELAIQVRYENSAALRWQKGVPN